MPDIMQPFAKLGYENRREEANPKPETLLQGIGLQRSPCGSPEGSCQYRFHQLAAEHLPITPISFHPPADNTTLTLHTKDYTPETRNPEPGTRNPELEIRRSLTSLPEPRYTKLGT